MTNTHKIPFNWRPISICVSENNSLALWWRIRAGRQPACIHIEWLRSHCCVYSFIYLFFYLCTHPHMRSQSPSRFYSFGSHLIWLRNTISHFFRASFVGTVHFFGHGCVRVVSLPRGHCASCDALGSFPRIRSTLMAVHVLGFVFCALLILHRQWRALHLSAYDIWNKNKSKNNKIIKSVYCLLFAQ